MDDRSSRGSYASNVYQGVLALAVTSAISFLFTPFLIRSLGEERYGLWAFAFSLVQLSFLLDLGLLSTTRRFQASAIASGSLADSSLVMGVSFRFYIPIGLTAGLAMLAVGMAWSGRVAPAHLEGEFALLLVAMAFHLVLLFWRAPYAGALFGSGGVGAERLMGIVPRVALFVVGGTLILVWRPDLVSMAVAVAVGAVLSFVATFAFVSYRLPGLRPSGIFSGGPNKFVKPMLLFSGSVLLLTIGGSILQFGPPVAIGLSDGAEAVAYFAIASLVVGYLYQLMQALGAPVFPVASEVNAQGTDAQLTELYVTSTRVQLAAALALCFPVGVLAGPMIGLWIGPEFAWTGAIVAILLAGQFFRFGAIPGRHILTATREIRSLGVAEVMYGSAVLASLWLVLSFSGLAGEAMLLAVAGVLAVLAGLYSGVGVHLIAGRQLDLPVSTIFTRLYGSVALAAVLLVPAGLAASVFVDSDSIVSVVVGFVALFALATGCAFALALNRNERAALHRRLVGAYRLLRRGRRRVTQSSLNESGDSSRDDVPTEI